MFATVVLEHHPTVELGVRIRTSAEVLAESRAQRIEVLAEETLLSVPLLFVPWLVLHAISARHPTVKTSSAMCSI
jgi:hypothetical protein